MSKVRTSIVVIVFFLASASQAYTSLDLCTIPVYMDVEAEVEECPFFSCISIKARANFGVQFGLRIDEVDPGFMDWDAYYEGGNTIPGDGNWHTLQVCVLAWNPTEPLENSGIEVLVATITITVKPSAFHSLEAEPPGMYVQLEKCSEYEFVLEQVECVIDVDIDIKFGTFPNSINLKSKKGVTPVAIFGSEDFDVQDIDPSTVEFAGISPLRWAYEDLPTEPNPLYIDPVTTPEESEFIGDGNDDIVFHFSSPALRVDNGGDLDGASTEATLTGETIDGIPIEGTDSVDIIKY